MASLSQSAAAGRPGNALETGVWLAAAMAAGLAVWIYFDAHQSASSGPAAPPFVVTATGIDNHIRLSWSPDVPEVRAATGGTLEVRDGDKSASYPVTAKVVKRGSLDYERNSDDVKLTLVLLDNGRPGAQSVVRVLETEVPQAPPATVAAPPQSVAAPPAKPVAKPVAKAAVPARKAKKKPPKKQFLFIPHY